jgi:hypothetical protein
VPLVEYRATTSGRVDDAGSTLAVTAVASGAGRGGSVVKSGDSTGGAGLGSRAFCARGTVDIPHGKLQFEEWAGLGTGKRGQSGGRKVLNGKLTALWP